MNAVRPVYPLSAIVGQEGLKRALLLNAVDPTIGGALIRGEKGTAKSTAARALQALLPELEVVEGCPLNCAPPDAPETCPWCSGRAAAGAPRPVARRRVPVVELPVAATEDRVAGSFNLEDAIQQGKRRFEPGLLAAANRGILYVDEVNLLPDHLVDVILDAAATGVHHVEREGISVTHPARFLLAGTMNPEEGELRPQLLDRFGLTAEITAPHDPAERALIVRRRVAFDADPTRFVAQWQSEEDRLRRRIARAIETLPSVRVEDGLVELIAHICVACEVEGLRGDIVIYKAAAALAALDGREAATAQDVRTTADLALPHRRRRRPHDEPGLDRDRLDRLAEEYDERRNGGTRGRSGERGEGSGEGGDSGGSNVGSGPDGTVDSVDGYAGETPAAQTLSAGEQWIAPAPVRAAPDLPEGVRPARTQGAQARPRQPTRSRRAGNRTQMERGHFVGSVIPHGRLADVAFDATIRAAAPYQEARRTPARGDDAAPVVRLRRADVRQKVYEGRRGRLLLFAVDASGSMAAHRRMALAKGTVQALLLDAYRRRDQVGLIAFSGHEARLVLPPTNSTVLADRRLVDLPTGGRTPLAAALALAEQTIGRHRRAHAGSTALLVLVSDGRANVAMAGGDPWDEALAAAGRLKTHGVAAVVVDGEAGGLDLGFGRALSEALGAMWLPLTDTTAGALTGHLRGGWSEALDGRGGCATWV